MTRIGARGVNIGDIKGGQTIEQRRRGMKSSRASTTHQHLKITLVS